MKIAERIFGYLRDGRAVKEFELENGSGISVGIITYGGIIRWICVPGRDTAREDILLGADDLEQIAYGQSFSAMIVGRVANRTANARFQLNGRSFSLEKNEGENNLHSGKANYAKRLFEAEPFEKDSCVGVTLYLYDGGEGGYEVPLDLWVTYSLNEEGELSITYRSVPQGDTVVNLTNHAYFNLAGHGSGPINGQSIKLCADFYTPVEADKIPTGEILSVESTAFDLREMISFEELFRRIPGGYDHNFVLRGRGMRLVAVAEDMKSGRRMEVYSDMPGVQLYTMNMPEDFVTVGKSGKNYVNHSAFCLETQFFPDSVNCGHFPSPVQLAGEEYISRTIFKFSLME